MINPSNSIYNSKCNYNNKGILPFEATFTIIYTIYYNVNSFMSFVFCLLYFVLTPFFLFFFILQYIYYVDAILVLYFSVIYIKDMYYTNRELLYV